VVAMAPRSALSVGRQLPGSGGARSRFPLEAAAEVPRSDPAADRADRAADRADEADGAHGAEADGGRDGSDRAERTIRVVIADDEYLVREGARSVLSAVPGMQVVGVAADPTQLAALIDEVSPDAVLLDIRMPPTYRTEGIVAAQKIRVTHPHIGVVILSQYSDPEYALELLREGSSRVAYLLKERLGDHVRLVGAIREVVAGGSVLDPKVVDSLMEAQRRRSRSRLHGLTEREHEVLGLMASGRNNAGIAREMVLSERAVEKHINSIFHRLGLNREMDINHRVTAVLFFLQRSTD
jgi:DNA-binding NarL/FixJ family response regulator